MERNKQKIQTILLMLFCFVVSACHRVTDKKSGDSGQVSLDVYNRIMSSPDSILLLHSYYLSSAYLKDEENTFVGYNDRENSLDVIHDSTFVDRIRLERHGKNGIAGRIISILPINRDSIFLFDLAAFYLIDRQGNVLHKHREKKIVFLDCNYAMHTAMMGWYGDDILLYPIDDNGKYKVMHYSIKDRKVVNETELDFPTCNPDGKKSYADMKYPNVTFNGNKIIYNYPYDSDVRTIDLRTGERMVYSCETPFAPKHLDAYDKKNGNFEDWLEYDWANVHFFEVFYLPKSRLYARLMLGGIKIKEYKDRETIVDARTLYLTILDEDFNVLSHHQLQDKRYNNFHGWCMLSGSIAIFVDNLLGKDYDVLDYDEIIPVYNKMDNTDSSKEDKE